MTEDKEIITWRKYKPDVMVRALQENFGLVYRAAKALGCSPQTIYNYAKEFPEVQEAIDNERGDLVDLGTLGLRSAILDKEGWAIMFVLSTLGKERGFVRRDEITGKDGQPIHPPQVNFVWDDGDDNSGHAALDRGSDADTD